MNTDSSTTMTAENDTVSNTEAGPELTSSATIAELTVPVADFALGDTIDAIAGVAFEIERVVAHNGAGLTPFVWATGAERGALERALEDDPSVVAFDLLTDFEEDENEFLYRMEWGERTDCLTHLLVDEGGALLAAATAQGQWNLRLLVSERAALARTHAICEQAGLVMSIARIYELDEGRQGRFGLTDGQQEALLFAFENGYYEIPRRMMAQEFAADLGISHQALSERLRRAHGNLVENAIVIGVE